LLALLAEEKVEDNMVLPVNTPVLAGTIQPITTPFAASLTSAIKGFGDAAMQFFKSKDTGAKIAKIGIGVGVAGAGVGIGASAASAGVGSAGKGLANDFNLPVEFLAIVAIVIIVLILVSKRR